MTKAELCALVADVCEVASLTLEDDYRETPLWGSLTAFALKVALKQRGGIEVSFRDLNNYTSVGDLARAVGVVQ